MPPPLSCWLCCLIGCGRCVWSRSRGVPIHDDESVQNASLVMSLAKSKLFLITNWIKNHWVQVCTLSHIMFGPICIYLYLVLVDTFVRAWRHLIGRTHRAALYGRTLHCLGVTTSWWSARRWGNTHLLTLSSCGGPPRSLVLIEPLQTC